jgi:hypothetical protein
MIEDEINPYSPLFQKDRPEILAHKWSIVLALIIVSLGSFVAYFIYK